MAQEGSTSSRSRRGAQVAVALVATLLALGAAEVGARALFRLRHESWRKLVLTPHTNAMQIESRYVSHPFLPFALGAGRDDTILWSPPPWPELEGAPQEHEWRVRTNHWGFRGAERELAKPPDTLRVVCIGGSTTYDTNTDGETWPERLEALLAEAHPTRRVEVLNLGMNAASLPFHVVQLALLGIHFQPDLVIIYPGHNDLWSGLGLEGFRPDYSHRLGHWDDSRKTAQRLVPRALLQRSAFLTGLTVALDRWRGIDYDLVRQIMRPAAPAEDPLEGFWAFENDLVTLEGIARAHGARLLVITPHWGFRKNEVQDELAARILAAGARHEIPVLDAARLFPSGDIELQIDDVHFSSQGSALFAELIAARIAELDLLDADSRSPPGAAGTRSGASR